MSELQKNDEKLKYYESISALKKRFDSKLDKFPEDGRPFVGACNDCGFKMSHWYDYYYGIICWNCYYNKKDELYRYCLECAIKYDPAIEFYYDDGSINKCGRC